MTSGTTARRRRRARDQRVALSPTLHAELQARVADAARRREAVVLEAKRQRRIAEQGVAANFDRIKTLAHASFEAERTAILEEIEQRAEDAVVPG